MSEAAIQKARPGAPIGNKNAQKHGIRTLKAALRQLGSRAIDRRTVTGHALAEWRQDEAA